MGDKGPALNAYSEYTNHGENNHLKEENERTDLKISNAKWAVNTFY